MTVRRFENGSFRCPYCDADLTLAEEDIEFDLENKRIIGDWRCTGPVMHTIQIIGLIEVVDDDE